MRIGILGTGSVGQTLAGKLLTLGHEVTLGSRAKDNPAGAAWARPPVRPATPGRSPKRPDSAS